MTEFETIVEGCKESGDIHGHMAELFGPAGPIGDMGVDEMMNLVDYIAKNHTGDEQFENALGGVFKHTPPSGFRSPSEAVISELLGNLLMELNE